MIYLGLSSNYEDDGVWRTIHGRAIFIKKGESLQDAMRRSGVSGAKGKGNSSPDPSKIVGKIHGALGTDHWRASSSGGKADIASGGTITLTRSGTTAAGAKEHAILARSMLARNGFTHTGGNADGPLTVHNNKAISTRAVVEYEEGDKPSTTVKFKKL